MTLFKLIEDGLFLELNCTNKEEFFEELSKILLDKKMVSDDFLEAIKKREEEFPTGLETSSMGVAVPHVDSKYVNCNALVLCKFNTPIIFKRMDAIEKDIKVKEAFVLLINNDGKHMEALQDLTKIWQNSAILEGIYMANSKEEIISLIKED